jgi:hypothetical protein
MEWEPVYLSIFRCVVDEEGNREVQEVSTSSSSQGFEEPLARFLGTLVNAMSLRRSSLGRDSACRSYQFGSNSRGEEDSRLMDQLLHCVSSSSFSSHAQVVASKYAQSPKAREGILFILNANVTYKKVLSPSLFVLKTDFQSGIASSQTGLENHDQLVLPELKKALVYPFHDGYQFHFDQVKVYQKTPSLYFQRVLELQSLPSQDQIVDEILHNELEEQRPGEFDQYFRVPLEDRLKQREVFGQNRVIREENLLDSDEITHVSHKTQMKAVDQNTRPVRLRLNIDDGLRFEGGVDQLNERFYFATHGTEKYLIVRGEKFETKSHFQSVEFMKLDTITELFNRLELKKA